MLKSFATKHNLALRKGQNSKIFLTLIWNSILFVKLRLYKKLHHITKPIVHYYAVCWNEEAILPWMFKYYDQFVAHFTIYDNYSSDSTEDIIKKNRKAEIIKFGEEGRFDDSANLQIKNKCWKRSRGKADWVVVCDMDEFLYHPNLENLLQKLVENKVSFPTTVGYEMYGESVPEYDGHQQLTALIQRGVRSKWFDKHIIFDPHKIVDIHFDPGAHHANPTGIVNQGLDETPLKILHYKNLGLDYLLSRYKQLGERLSQYNTENNLGTHYLSKQKEIEVQFANGFAAAEQIVYCFNQN